MTNSTTNGAPRKPKNKKKFSPLNLATVPAVPSGLAPPSLSSSPAAGPPSTSTSATPQQQELMPALLPGSTVVLTDPATAATEELCFICADAVVWYAVGECNHRACHLCSLRLRALYKQNTCAMCKTDLHEVVYTSDATKAFQDFNLRSLPNYDRKLKIHFDSPEIYEDVMILLRFNCPDPSCDVACNGGWRELKDHVRKKHEMLMCELCTRHKKLFTHEHALYTRALLDRHNKVGDPDDPSFKGHPSCGFCRNNFYGQDELFEHCREKHEQCFLCQRNGVRNQYYKNYLELESHFQNEHYPCYNHECLEKKFVVFNSEIDLAGHELEVHGTTKARSKGQHLDLNFTYAGSPSRDFDPPGARRPPSKRTERAAATGRNGRDRDGNHQPPVTDSNSGASFRNSDGHAPPGFEPPQPQQQQAQPQQAGGKKDRRLRPPPGFGSALSGTQSAAAAAVSSDDSSPNMSPARGRPSPPPQAASTYQQNFPSPRDTLPPPGPTSAPPAPLFPTPSEAHHTGSSAAASIGARASGVSAEEAEVFQKVQQVLNNSATRINEFKSLAALFRDRDLSADDFVAGFMSLACEHKNGKALKDAENDAAKVWRRMADVAPGNAEDEEEARRKRNKGKGKFVPLDVGPTARVGNAKVKNDMLRALNDWKVIAAADTPPPRPTTGSYANSAAAPSSVLPVSYGSAPGSNAAAAAAAATRVLVIKNKASKQRGNVVGLGTAWRDTTAAQSSSQTTAATTAGSKDSVWERVSKNMDDRTSRVTAAREAEAGFDKRLPVTFRGAAEEDSEAVASSYSLPSYGATAASTPAAAGAGTKQTSRAPPIAGRVANASEFPGLPTRKPKPAAARPINGRIGGGWGPASGNGSDADAGANDGSTRKSKKGTTLMHFG
ncbi:hypothetical protein HDU88_008670 [Geranomyces variabilis]|nr:hypothetical protein HDU88_008670 [Geranomyces variabilis]